MKHPRHLLIAPAVLVAIAVGAIATAGALGEPPAAPEPPDEPGLTVTTHGDRPVDEVRDEIRRFYDEVERTGLVPVGVAEKGDGPYGWVDAELYVSVDGRPHPDLKVYDAAGAHVGWVVFGLPPMSIETYQADPAAHRAAGLERMAALGDQSGP